MSEASISHVANVDTVGDSPEPWTATRCVVTRVMKWACCLHPFFSFHKERVGNHWCGLCSTMNSQADTKQTVYFQRKPFSASYSLTHTHNQAFESGRYSWYSKWKRFLYCRRFREEFLTESVRYFRYTPFLEHTEIMDLQICISFALYERKQMHRLPGWSVGGPLWLYHEMPGMVLSRLT